MAPTVARCRAVNAPHLVAVVRAGAVFVNGKNPRSPTPRGMTIYRMDHAGRDGGLPHSHNPASTVRE